MKPTETVHYMQIQNLKEKPRDIMWFVRAYYNDGGYDELDSKTYWVQDKQGYDVAVILTVITDGREVITQAQLGRDPVPVPNGSSVDEVKLMLETFIKADIKGEAS